MRGIEQTKAPPTEVATAIMIVVLYGVVQEDSFPESVKQFKYCETQ